MLRYQVEGMSCAHCVQAVTKAVKSVEPGAEVQVDLDAGQVTISGSEQREALAKAIEQAGYTVAG
jgi:copper chaperone